MLEEPYLPLHNNPAELGAHKRVSKRDVSQAAASEAEVKAWDALQSVVATCKKLGVNVYHYLLDRVSGKNELVSLAQSITERSSQGQGQGQGQVQQFTYYPSERSRRRSLVARAKHKGPQRQVHRAGSGSRLKTKVASSTLPVIATNVSG